MHYAQGHIISDVSWGHWVSGVASQPWVHMQKKLRPPTPQFIYIHFSESRKHHTKRIACFLEDIYYISIHLSTLINT